MSPPSQVEAAVRRSAESTVASLFFDRSRVHPTRVAVEDGGRARTYAELATRVRKLAGALRASGVGRGDRIAFLSENRLEVLELFLAAAHLGVIVACQNWRLTSHELIGKLTFTEMTYFHVTGTLPTPAETAVVDACLVTLMEHGITPSVISTRLTYGSAPEAMQGAIAAGILGVGSVFVGTVEGCAALLARIVAAGEGMESEARRVAEEHRAAKKPIPGFGHPQHRPDDPRTPRVLAVAEDGGVAGPNIAALRALATAVDAVYGKHVTINATGAIAAALADAGIPAEIMRGFAILARCAGLVGHVREEQENPAMRALWEAGDRAVPYRE